MTITESEEILKSIKNVDGIIIRWPKKKEEKRAVLEYLITKFEKGKRYSELEVADMDRTGNVCCFFDNRT